MNFINFVQQLYPYNMHEASRCFDPSAFWPFARFCDLNVMLTSYKQARGLYREISDRGKVKQTEPVERGLHTKTEVRYFSANTEQARLI